MTARGRGQQKLDVCGSGFSGRLHDASSVEGSLRPPGITGITT
jgi:hypothetical protein